MLELTGHAETGEKGNDLVCAGVSSLVYGFAKAVANLPKERTSGGVVDVGREDGHALVKVVCKDRKTYKKVRAYLEPVYQGLGVLQACHPSAIVINVVEL